MYSVLPNYANEKKGGGGYRLLTFQSLLARVLGKGNILLTSRSDVRSANPEYFQQSLDNITPEGGGESLTTRATLHFTTA